MQNTEEREEEKVMLAMAPWDFDQSPKGWRKFADAHEYVKAARVIQKYISVNSDAILSAAPDKNGKKIHLEVMHFHGGQMLAFAGPEYYAEAVQSFSRALWIHTSWNAYVSATIGFLTNDKKKISEARRTIERVENEDPASASGNGEIVKNFEKAMDVGERSYEKVYSWPRGK